MTEMMQIEMECSVCGKTSEQWVLLSSNKFGYQDLDTRPPEMYRSTMKTWILECPHCGYVAKNLKEELKINEEYLKSNEYKTCNDINFKSDLSKIFYKKYLIDSEKFEDKDAYFALLHCAWACDDAKDLEKSKYIRQLAIELVDKIIKDNKNINDNVETKQDFRRKSNDVDNFIVMKADLLRRIGEYDQLIKDYERLTLKDELLNKIIKFQVEKAYEKDNKCYTLEEVL